MSNKETSSMKYIIHYFSKLSSQLKTAGKFCQQVILVTQILPIE
jgi:hypothetical protein